LIYFLDINGVLREVKSFKKEFGLTWGQINCLGYDYFSFSGREFFKRYNLEPTIFNVAVFEKLNGVFLYSGVVERLNLKLGYNEGVENEK
jgi:hypothetical protein